ncbi:MAG: serine hydrolase [Anaerolineae bacterium]|nr:serine hydrolase [Anaerolineae bacterium]
MKNWQFVIFVLIVALLFAFLFQLNRYTAYRELLAPGLSLAGLPVGEKTEEEARALLTEAFSTPLTLHYLDETITLNPRRVNFRLQTDATLEQARQVSAAQDFWTGFINYLLGNATAQVDIPVRASFDEEAVRQQLLDIAAQYDHPLQPPRAVVSSLTYLPGQREQRLDVEASLPLVIAALNSATQREVDLIVRLGDEEPPPIDMSVLQQMLEGRLDNFDGIYSIYVKDLTSGEELALNADVAYAGMSIIKIAIMTEAYRHLDGPPDADTTKILTETMTLSGNFTANLLLRYVIGDGDAYQGVQRLNESLRYLGLVNTFMAAPYDEDVLPQHIRTPANSRTDINTNPDPFMQTTPQDMGLLLEMIYQCANGGGTLIAAYPDQITPDECRDMLDMMSQNHIGALIEAGVPEGTRVAHKHGWIGDTHGDAGIVFSPGGDYVLCMYLYHPDWLEWEVSAPIMADLSQAVYRYFMFHKSAAASEEQ